MDPLKEELGRAEMDIEKAKSHKKHYEGKMKEHEKDIRNARRDLEQKQKEVEVRGWLSLMTFLGQNEGK